MLAPHVPPVTPDSSQPLTLPGFSPVNPQASAVPSAPSVLPAGMWGTPLLQCTGVYWGELGCTRLTPEVEQHHSQPSPVLCVRASILQHNKPQNKAAK